MPIPFRPIARLLARTLHPPARVDTSAIEPFFRAPVREQDNDGVLFTINHYTAPGIPVWWSAILVSAVIPADIHWVVTSGWTNSGWMTGVTHWLFPRGARLFGFTPMPAMPPDPAEVEQRAAAVRQVLRYARLAPRPVIGLMPEGGDTPGGILGALPEGSGRFIHLISKTCPWLVPVGWWSDQDQAQLKFGSPYQLEVPGGLSSSQVDKLVGDTVMKRIAACLPAKIAGAWGEPPVGGA